MKTKWWLKYNGTALDENGNKVFNFKIHWIYVVWVRTKYIFIEWFTPTPYFREFAQKHPNEFEEIIKASYIDRIVNWLSGKIK